MTQNAWQILNILNSDLKLTEKKINQTLCFIYWDLSSVSCDAFCILLFIYFLWCKYFESLKQNKQVKNVKHKISAS